MAILVLGSLDIAVFKAASCTWPLLGHQWSVELAFANSSASQRLTLRETRKF
jgi:hypothetical protein